MHTINIAHQWREEYIKAEEEIDRLREALMEVISHMPKGWRYGMSEETNVVVEEIEKALAEKE